MHRHLQFSARLLRSSVLRGSRGRGRATLLPSSSSALSFSSNRNPEPRLLNGDQLSNSRGPKTTQLASTSTWFRNYSGDPSSASSGGDDGVAGDGGGDDGSGAPSYEEFPVAATPGSGAGMPATQTVPDYWPVVPVLAVNKHPVFPKFIKIVEVTDDKLMAILRRKVRLNQPYVGVFVKKDDENMEVRKRSNCHKWNIYRVYSYVIVNLVMCRKSSSLLKTFTKLEPSPRLWKCTTLAPEFEWSSWDTEGSHTTTKYIVLIVNL